MVLGCVLAVIPLVNDANILLMHTSGAPALSVPPANAKGYGYRFQATNDRFGRAFAEIAVKEGYKRPATMAFNKPPASATRRASRRRGKPRATRSWPRWSTSRTSRATVPNCSG